MSAPPGWYVDPTTDGKQRYWDGTGWTEHFADNGLPPPPPQSQLVSAPHTSSSVAIKGTRPWWRRKRFMIPAAFVGAIAVISAIAKPKPTTVTSASTTVASRSSESPSIQAPTTVAVVASIAPTTTTSSISSTTVKATTSAVPTTTVKATSTVAPTTTLAGFGSGTLRVNDQIAPGRYSATATSGCYWARLSGTSGQLADVLSNDNATGHVIVDILATDAAFQSSRCGRFSLYAPPTTPTSVIKDGDWVVGDEVEPGTYETVGAKLCYWSRNRDATGDLRTIIANDNVDGPTTVTISAGEMFRSSRCGTWMKVS
jgi:Protein of unknown function (DUF2510)